MTETKTDPIQQPTWQRPDDSVAPGFVAIDLSEVRRRYAEQQRAEVDEALADSDEISARLPDERQRLRDLTSFLVEKAPSVDVTRYALLKITESIHWLWELEYWVDQFRISVAQEREEAAKAEAERESEAAQ